MSNMIQTQLPDKERTFSGQENAIWQKLYNKQYNNLQNKAFTTFLDNLEKFDLPSDRVPSLSNISEKLRQVTGWEVKPVTGLLQYEEYFSLLSQKKFPSTTFIRSKYEENLSIDPDIFHEVFGHCTMLLSQEYADFLQEFAKFALTVKPVDRALFARLIWFTTETGLIDTGSEIKIYGSSIMSSYAEATYCLESPEPVRKQFNIVNIFREPYRADLLQKVYYVIERVDQVYDLINDIPHLYDALAIARQKGELQPLFPVQHNKYSNIGHCIPLEEVVYA